MADHFQSQQLLQIEVATSTQPGTVTIRLQPGQPKPSANEPGTAAGDIVYREQELLVSTGTPEKTISDTYRVVGSSIARWLIQHRVPNAVIKLDQEEDSFDLPSLLEGLYLGAYQFNRYKKIDDVPGNVTIQLVSQEIEPIIALVDRAKIITSAVNLARDWAHEPANVINPITLADRAFELAKKYQLPIKILTDTQLEAMGAGAIHAVGKGSATPSRMIIIEYPGKNPLAKPVILVGKAITFDTGGYSLKSTENILGMKYDKCGGMAVLATLQAAAELHITTPIIGIVAAAENMICDHAYRPDDIITTLSGKTVEIISTDAEGRLVLADALTYAQNSYQPRALIDLATLTGGVVTALGRVRAGLLSNNDELAQQLFEAGQATHERLWRLPLDEDYAKLLKGDDADLKNSGGREAHCILGGMFLQNFVDEKTPWAHLDIAGMADTPKDLPYSPKGATGFGVRLLIHYLENL